VQAWNVISTGPYKREAGYGELVLHTKGSMNRHTSKSFNRNRFFEKDGVVFYRTRDVVHILKGQPGGAPRETVISMVDKTTCPFQLKGGEWVRAGVLEMEIEGDRKVIQNAALLGSPETAHPAVVVWTANEAETWSDDELLGYCRDALKDIAERWEVPTVLLRAEEPWEYRPRAKIREVLQMRYGSAVNRLLPGAVPATIAGSINRNTAQNEYFSQFMMAAMSRLPGHFCGYANLRQQPLETPPSLCEMLLGCVGGACMLRSKDGRLREPAARMKPYDPTDPWEIRVERFDSEPWHLWDLQNKVRAVSLVDAVRGLRQHRQYLVDALPSVVPSMGLLLDFGIRFRMRLDCAIRIAMERPELYEMQSTIYVYDLLYQV